MICCFNSNIHSDSQLVFSTRNFILAFNFFFLLYISFGIQFIVSVQNFLFTWDCIFWLEFLIWHTTRLFEPNFHFYWFFEILTQSFNFALSLVVSAGRFIFTFNLWPNLKFHFYTRFNIFFQIFDLTPNWLLQFKV